MTISLAIAGCGVMGRRHVLGLKKLQEIDRLRFDLVAVCDPLESSATAMADLAESLLGARPAIFADPADLPADVVALDVTTSPNLHARIGIQALQAGRHVQMEKPITLTIAEGRDLLAAQGDRKLSVAENYRRDPINRLAKALIDAGVLGRPFLIVQSSSGRGRERRHHPLATSETRLRHRHRHGRALRRHPRISARPAGNDRRHGRGDRCGAQGRGRNDAPCRRRRPDSRRRALRKAARWRP